MMEAIILAGGMGTRLSKAIADIPKPMAPVNDKPFLFYLLNWIKNYPVERIILSTGYRAESIFEYFGSSFENIPLEYVTEEKPLGTGGAFIKALESIRGINILILNGDTWFPINLNEFYTFHLKNNNVFSLEKEILVKEAGTSVLKGVVFDDPFLDIGIPDDYHRAGSFMKTK